MIQGPDRSPREWGKLLVLAAICCIDPDPSKALAGEHGTRVDFLCSPQEAAERAQKEKKLYFLLHVSGNFEDKKFT